MTGITTQGTVTADDYKLTLNGQKPIVYYYEPGVYGVGLTVADRAGQTGSAASTVTITQGDPPVADAGPDIDLGEADVINGTWDVQLNGTRSTDDFGIYRWDWDFGDSTAGSGDIVSHTYNKVGTYTVTLTVTDHALQKSIDSLILTITPGQPPVAEAGPDVYLGEVDALNGMWPVRFNGTKSTDDYGVKRWEWDFGDGSTGTGKITNHSYLATGVYTVSLVVYDEIPQASQPDTMTVTIVAGASPVANAGGPYAALEDDVAAGKAFLLFDGSKSTDADAQILHYIWDFGTETFDGLYFDKKLWDYSYGVYPGVYGDYVTIWGDGSWTSHCLFTSYTVDRRPGLVAQASIQEAGSTMFGFKHGNNTSYSYMNMPYAIYLYDGNLKVHEDGADRGDTGYDYVQDQWYDYKIVINDVGGADYFYKKSGTTTWTLIYRSTYTSGTQLKAGLTVANNYANVDNFRLMAAGKTVNFPVRHPGQVTLTVEDQAHQLNSQTVPITVVGSNGPAANPGGPYFSTFELPTTLDGSSSTDDRGVAKYLWDFGDGTALGSGPNPVHAYAVGTNTASVIKTVTLTVYDAAGHSDTKTTTITLATGPLVVCVPWQFSGGVEVPHHTWSGKAIRLKGIVKGGIGTLTYTWKFGDGTPDATGTVTNKYVIEATHTYTGAEGATFNATLTVEDAQGNTHTDTYPVAILPAASLDTKKDVAIDEGLWWLHKNQTRDTASYNDGKWSSYGSYYGSVTGSALQTFLINGHSETGSDTKDPYVETVRRGMTFLFKNLVEVGIGNQTYGNPDYPYDGTGNNLGLATHWSDRMPYEGGMVMDGIVSTATPNKTAWAGPVNVLGRSYKDILQDMIDAYAWGQYDDTGSVGGGWRYGWNEWPDNSACQWAAIGMIPSTKAPWYCVIPQWVRQRNNVWLAYSYDGTNKWFGYTGTGANSSGHATRPSGMVQMVMSVDNYRSDSRWLATEGWFAVPSNWSWFVSVRSYYGWYAFVKAMRLSGTQTLSNGFDWYRGASGIAENLIALPETDGGWPSGDYGKGFNTAWSIVMLTSSLFNLPPVAEAGPDIIWGYDIPLTFDGSYSYHLDPNRSIALYEWDFNGDGAYEYSNTNPVASYTFPFSSDLEYPVTYTAVLRVTDNMGDTATDTRSVKIQSPPRPPFAVITGPTIFEGAGIGTAGLPVTLDGTHSFSIDTGVAITSYEWIFDGYDFSSPSSTDPVAYPVYNSPGTYHVGLRVWDDGTSNNDTPQVSAPAYLVINIEANRQPVAEAGGPYTVVEGTPLTLAGSGTDPNLAQDPLTFAWDLDNDGVFDDANGPTPSFTWTEQGTYQIALKVSDGLLSATDTATVTVQDGAPTAEFTWASSGGGGDVAPPPTEGIPVNFTDLSTTPVDPIVAWAWDFGGAGTSALQNPSFTFLDGGVYAVTLTVTDADGSTASVSHDVTVADIPPTANNDTARVPQNGGAASIKVLLNDTWLPGPPDVLTIVGKTDGTRGIVAITGGGTGLTYQPTTKYLGADTFTYTIADGHGLTSTATVNVTIYLPGDANYDCTVNVMDLIYVRNRINKPVDSGDNWKADVNRDNKINVMDLIYIRNKINTKCQ